MSLLVAGALVAGGPMLGGAHADGTDPATEFPKAGCVTFTDTKADSHPLTVTTAVPASAPNDPDLDLTSLTLRTTADQFVAYVGVDKLDTGPTTTDGHRFTVDFTFNKHVFSLSGSAYSNGSGGIRDGLAQTGQAGHVTQLGVDVPALVPAPGEVPATDKGFKTSGLKVTFDAKNSRVVMQLPIADIVKYGGAPFAGGLTAVDAKAATDEWAVSSIADTTEKDNATTGTLKWTVGDNACFAPPPAVLANVGATTAQYGDSAAVAATITTAGGQALAGKTVSFALAGSTVTATSDATGKASALVPMTATAGSTTLTVAFAGDSSADKASLDVPFTIAVEKTVTKLAVTKNANKRTVAITLLDDDMHAVGAQKLAVYVNGKQVATVTTSSTGTATFTKAQPTQTVKVVYAGLAGKYAGSSAQTKV